MVGVLEDAIVEIYGNLRQGVHKTDHKSLRFVRISEEGGQSLQAVFAGDDPVGGVAQFRHMVAGRELQFQRGHPVVPAAPPGEFQGKGVQGIGAVRAGLRGIGGEAPVRVADEIGHVAVHPGAVPGVQQDTMGIHLHLIGGVAGL